jgi:diguanylate cyclase (GGDEF)-like protein
LASAKELLLRTTTVAGAQAAVEGLIALAFSDPVTGLGNRRALDEIAKLPLAFEADPYGVVMIDLTGFKRVNVEGSHAAGDAALGRVGETILRMCDSEGRFARALPFRYGGDEFCIIVPTSIFKDFTDAPHLARLVWKDFTLQEKALGFGAAVGIASPDESVGLVELMARADTACKVSKDRGDVPVVWSQEISNETASINLRKRCPSCTATISLQIAGAKFSPDGFKSCPNCGGLL